MTKRTRKQKQPNSLFFSPGNRSTRELAEGMHVQ